MKQIQVVSEPRTVPIYDDTTGRFLGWRMNYSISDTVDVACYFLESFFSNSYKKMCRFRNKLQVVNENNK